MVSSLISESCRYEGLVSLDSWKKISVVSKKWNRRRSWAHNLWEVRYCLKGQTPHWAKCTKDLAPKTSNGRGKGGSPTSGGRSGRWERQMKSAKWGSKREQTITQAHDTWMWCRAQTLVSSTSFFPFSTLKNWKKNTDATFGIVGKGFVLVVLLLILGGDGSLMWLLFGSLIGVSSVHSCPICSVWDSNVS